MTMLDLAKTYIGTRQGDKRHKEIIDTYNQIKPLPRGYRMKYSDSWCMAFISFLEFRTGVKNPVYECSCVRAYNILKKGGYEVKKADVSVGDLIFYDWGNNGTIDHVGLISGINGDTLSVLEGNYSKQVKVRTISRKSKEIEGFFRIEGNDVAAENKSEDLIDDLAQKVIRGEYGTGKDRKNRLGHLYGDVQKRVNEILRHTKKSK